MLSHTLPMKTSAELRRSSRTRKATEKAKELVLEHDDAGAMAVEEDNDWEDENNGGDEDDTLQPTELHPRDLDNFLKLCCALKLYLSDGISEQHLLYGPEVIRPNHHYATHTAEFIRDYGPLREFWTFLFERLNKVLKSYRTNNHEGGQIEATFFREFCRTAQLNRTVSEGLQLPKESAIYQTCRAMHDATSDTRGTLQQLAEELDEHQTDAGVALALSPRSARVGLPLDIYHALLTYMEMRYPMQSFHSDIALHPPPASILLPNTANVFDYAIIAGHRPLGQVQPLWARSNISSIMTPSCPRNAGSSLLMCVGYAQPR
ncbi:hypothetical protein BD413DRAFT_610989 [Trametes elegans]|nr:hypothetical protein BD413DRAFT_610989 [Trametes elegans]